MKKNILKEAAFALEARDRLREFLIYEMDTGKFYWRDTGKLAGTPHKMGIIININKVNYLGHRLAWLFAYGRLPSTVKHLDGDKTNNRLSNLG